MRQFITFLFLFLPSLALAQKAELVTITGPEMSKVNSTMRADFGTGKSRICIPILIPDHAVYCYISISTASGNESKQVKEGIHLISQLSAKIATPEAQTISLLAGLAKGIVGGNRGSVLDVYLIPDMDNKGLFEYGSSFRHFLNYSRSNYNGGILTISCQGIAGRTIYLGLSNRNAVNSVWVNVEAVAAVIKQVTPAAAALQALNYTNLGWKAFERGDIEKCMEYSRKALGYDSAQAIAMLNLGLCHLIHNNEAEAIPLYMNALTILKQQDKGERQHYLQEALNDIRRARKKYPEMATGDDIVDLFKMEQHN